MTRLYI